MVGITHLRCTWVGITHLRCTRVGICLPLLVPGGYMPPTVGPWWVCNTLDVPRWVCNTLDVPRWVSPSVMLLRWVSPVSYASQVGYPFHCWTHFRTSLGLHFLFIMRESGGPVPRVRSTLWSPVSLLDGENTPLFPHPVILGLGLFIVGLGLFLTDLWTVTILTVIPSSTQRGSLSALNLSD